MKTYTVNPNVRLYLGTEVFNSGATVTSEQITASGYTEEQLLQAGMITLAGGS